MLMLKTIKFNVKQVKQKPLKILPTLSGSFRMFGILHLSRLQKHQHASRNTAYLQLF